MCKKQQDATGDGTDKRPEYRDDVRYANDNADQQRVVNFQNRQAGKADDADNHGINDFPSDKAAENEVRLTENVKSPGGCAFVVTDGVQDFLALTDEPLFGHLCVNKHNQCDKQIDNAGDQSQKALRDGVNGCVQVCIDPVGSSAEHSDDYVVNIWIPFIDTVKVAVKRSLYTWQIAEKSVDGFAKSRYKPADDEEEQKTDQDQDKQECQNTGCGLIHIALPKFALAKLN